MKRIILTPKEIFEKEFSESFPGYSPQEVDNLLDLIIADYLAYAETVAALKENEQILLETNAKLTQELRDVSSKIELLENGELNVNVDILKRISELEKKVFK